MQGYGSKDSKGTLFEDWDLSESGGAEPSEVSYAPFHQFCPLKFLSLQNKNGKV